MFTRLGVITHAAVFRQIFEAVVSILLSGGIISDFC